MKEKIIVLGSEYVLSAVNKNQYPTERLPEIAFIGRSNVGKSSLINSLLRRKNLARTSQTPGKTQTINFYKVELKIAVDEAENSSGSPEQWSKDELQALPDGAARSSLGSATPSISPVNFIRRSFYMVDLPGYGYAKTSKSNRAAWSNFIEEYFATAERLLFVCLLVDMRHEPMKSDLEMFNRLVHYNVPVLVTATKSDKLGRTAQSKQLELIKRTFHIPELDVLPYSSTKNEGRSDLLDVIAHSLLQ